MKTKTLITIASILGGIWLIIFMYKSTDTYKVNNNYNQFITEIYEEHQVYEALAFVGKSLNTISRDSLVASDKNLRRMKTDLQTEWTVFITHPKADISKFGQPTDDLIRSIETTISMYTLEMLEHVFKDIEENQRKFKEIIKEHDLDEKTYSL